MAVSCLQANHSTSMTRCLTAVGLPHQGGPLPTYLYFSLIS